MCFTNQLAITIMHKVKIAKVDFKTCASKHVVRSISFVPSTESRKTENIFALRSRMKDVDPRLSMLPRKIVIVIFKMHYTHLCRFFVNTFVLYFEIKQEINNTTNI